MADPAAAWRVWTDGALAGAYALVAIQHAQLAWRRPTVPGHLWLVAACGGALTVNLSGMALGTATSHGAWHLANIVGQATTASALLGFVGSMGGRRTAGVVAWWALQVTAGALAFTLDNDGFAVLTLLTVMGALVGSAVLAFAHAWRGAAAERLTAAGFATLCAMLGADVFLTQSAGVRVPGLAAVGFFGLFACLSVATSERFQLVHDELDALRVDLERRVVERTAVIDRANRVFQRYLPAPLVARILGDGQEPPDPRTERLVVTLLFADLQGFTAWSESRDPQRVTEVVNAWIAAATEAIGATGGALDKVMGDGIMAVWGAPTAQPLPTQARGAVEAGLDLILALERLKATWTPEEAGFSVRVGVHQAQAAVGNIGTRERWSWTALGAGVNLASRLEGAARPGTVLVSQAVWDQLGPDHLADRAEADAPVALTLKGIRDPVPARQLRPRGLPVAPAPHGSAWPVAAVDDP